MKPAFAYSVIQGRRQQLKYFGRQEQGAAITIALHEVLPKYGVREEISEDLLRSAVRFILQHFGHLGVNEIIFAYDYYFSQPDQKAGQSYYGEFSLASLGAVLSFYNDARKQIVGAVIREGMKIHEERQAKEEHDRRQKEFDENLPKMIEAAKEYFNHYVFLPIELYSAIEVRNPEMFSTEGKRYAYNLAIDVIENIIDNFPDYFEMEALTMSKNEQEKSRSFAIRIAKKICLWTIVFEKDVLDVDIKNPGTQTGFYSFFQKQNQNHV